MNACIVAASRTEADALFWAARIAAAGGPPTTVRRSKGGWADGYAQPGSFVVYVATFEEAEQANEILFRAEGERQS